MGRQARQELSAPWRALRNVHGSLDKIDALARQLIDVRRDDVRVACGADAVPAVIVRHDEDEIWLGGLDGREEKTDGEC